MSLSLKINHSLILEDEYINEKLENASLPFGFFEKICEFENFLMKEEDFITVQNLCRLYKIGIEHYSQLNSYKSQLFYYKLKKIFRKYSKFLKNLQEKKEEKEKVLVNKRIFNVNDLFNSYKSYYNEDDENNKENIMNLIIKNEINLSNSLKIVNNDILFQQKNFLNLRNLKRKSKVLREAVCKLVYIYVYVFIYVCMYMTTGLYDYMNTNKSFIYNQSTQQFNKT